MRDRGKSAEGTPSCKTTISTKPLWGIWKDFGQVLDKYKTELEKFYDEKANGLIVQGRDRMNMGKRVQSVFLIWRNEPYKETY